MSDTTPTKKKAPLWKQVAGALGGAAFAFALYQGYTFVSPAVQALVTLPTAPGVGDQGVVRMATKEIVEKQDRIDRRAQEIADRLGRAVPESVGVRRTGIAVEGVSPEGSSSSWRPISNVPAPGPLWPSGTVSHPDATAETAQTQAATSSSWSHSSVTPPAGSENRVMYGPWGWLKGAQKFASSSSTAPLAQVAAPHAGVDAATAQSSVPAGEPLPLTPTADGRGEWQPTVAEPPAEEPVVAEDTVHEAPSEDASTLPAPYEEPAPLMATMAERSEHLPQSGFGLGALALTAIGAVAGRRYARERA